MVVDPPWNGPVEYGKDTCDARFTPSLNRCGKLSLGLVELAGPGNNSNTGQWNLCPGADGKTHHDCRINMTHNWIRMVNPSGNGNGGYSAVRQLTIIMFSRGLLESFLHLGSAFPFVSWLSSASLRLVIVCTVQLVGRRY